jgi:putative membrane protein
MLSVLLVNWLVSATAVGVTAYLLPGVRVDGIAALFVTALVLGIINAVVRPVLLLLTLPVTIVTLGLFTFVINALLILFTSKIVPGFSVDGFLWALLFGLVLSVVNWGLHLFQQDRPGLSRP